MNGILGLATGLLQTLDPAAGALLGGVESLLGGSCSSGSSSQGGGLASLAASFLGGAAADASGSGVLGSIAGLLA